MEQFYTGDSESPAHQQDVAPPTVEDIAQRGYPLTAEEARVVHLSVRPWIRMGQVAAYAETFGLTNPGGSAPITTRHALIRTAVIREEAARSWAQVYAGAERLRPHRRSNR
jgi:hypothetical protein